MDDVEHLRRKSQEAQSDIEAFDNARSKAGDLNELFDVLSGKLRPDRQNPDGSALGGKSLSTQSILTAKYHGSAGNTVLDMANLKRIQTFLDEPQKRLGQVLADIEKEAGTFYGRVSSRRKSSSIGSQRMQREVSPNGREKQAERACLEDVPEMNKYLGPSSRFGDGDGSFWDRWLTTTGHFTENGNYAKADMPSRSMYSTGVVTPQSGFKRYQLDKLAFTRAPDSRVLTYAARRELGDRFQSVETPKRLRGAYSENSLSMDRSQEWFNEAFLAKTTGSRQSSAGTEPNRNSFGLGAEGLEDGRTPRVQHSFTSKSSRDGQSAGREAPSEAFAALEEKFRTLGTAGTDDTPRKRSAGWDAAVKEEAGRKEIIGAADSAGRLTSGDVSLLENGDNSLEGAMASLGLVHPNYFGRRARRHVYDYFKQVSRRRYQYGDVRAMSAIAPADSIRGHGPLAPLGAITNHSQRILEDIFQGVADEQDRDDTTRTHRLPPLATSTPGIEGAESEGLGGENYAEDGGDTLKAHGKDDRQYQITSRTKYLMRCMERNVAPRAHVIIRKTHTSKGMGDEMGGILADCLVGLPLMRELDLRDNMLTDRGLIPIVKAIKQRHDLFALDLSENKLDRWAARELALYFSDPRCTLGKLVLSRADVDDFEASNFVKHMKANKTLTYLDLSHNLIGSQESINYVRPEFYTGAEALADWISTGSCPLKYLDVSWNTIRLDSAVYFGKAVAHATNLEVLDLSFNCFGAKGGEAIGASLHVNTSLKTLRLASNAVNPRACFVICQGLLQNLSITDIDLSNNSLGNVGVGCVMALPAEVGDSIKIRLANCNFVVGCESCWFDDNHLRPSYDLRMEEPYDRAVAFHLIRRAARDEGLQLRRAGHATAGEADNEIQLVISSSQAESFYQENEIAQPLAVYALVYQRKFSDQATQESVFRKYDDTGTGSLSREGLGKALKDLALLGEHQVDLAMTRYDNGNGRVEESDFHDFVEDIVLQSKRRESRTKAFLAEESSPSRPWTVPPEGQLRLELGYQRLHNQGYHPSLENTDSVLNMMSVIGDGLTDVMTNALNFLSLNVEQGMRVYATVRAHVGGDKIKALAKVLPRMESPVEACLLKNTILRDLDERRKLRHELGPAYRPLMGMPMGHFELDLAKPMHRVAALKILESNNVEKLARQTRQRPVFDASQRGDWNNTRNETVNGKPCRLKGSILEAFPKAGLLEIDFTSTTRPPLAVTKQGAELPSGKKPMNTNRFFDLLKTAGFGDDEAWSSIPDQDGELDDILDGELPSRPRSKALFEVLRLLNANEAGPTATKKNVPSRPSMMDNQGSRGSSRQPNRQSVGMDQQAPPRRQSLMPQQSPPRRPIAMPQGQGYSRGQSAAQPESESGAKGLPNSTRDRGKSGNRHSARPGVAASSPSLNLRAMIGINATACRLDELIADKWVSIRQCRLIVLLLQKAFPGDDFLQDVVVDFVVTVYPRIVDVYDYLTLVGCLEDHSQAFVIKRVGWLAAWNPCRPEGNMELALDLWEERQVAKMLIHLAVDQQGDDYWSSSAFRWAINEPPIPGWMLPVAWQTEEGLPTKGILACKLASKSGGLRANWVLRMALAQAVSLSEVPPVSALAAASRGTLPGSAGEGLTEDGLRRAASTNDSTDVEGQGRSSVEDGADIEETPTRWQNLGGSFDRDFVDALCRQAGDQFFLYSARIAASPA